jgi:aspartate/methionine/tyrosine aminotransferase
MTSAAHLGIWTRKHVQTCYPRSLSVYRMEFGGLFHLRTLKSRTKKTYSHICTSIPQAYKWAEKYSPTPARPLLDMSQGVPGIPPQKSLQNALGKAGSSLSAVGYCPVEGEPALRTALAEEMKTIYGPQSDINSQDIALTAGCNMAFIAVIMSLADPGDQVILPLPWSVTLVLCRLFKATGTSIISMQQYRRSSVFSHHST